MNALERIRQYINAATPPPWFVNGPARDAPTTEVVAEDEYGDYGPYVAYEVTMPDAAFIANARTDLPKLLAIAEEAQAIANDCGYCNGGTTTNDHPDQNCPNCGHLHKLLNNLNTPDTT